MRQELTAEVAAAREQVWAALAGELTQRGAHVTVLEEHPPERLRLDLFNGLGERLLLEYELVTLDAANTAVHAGITPSGVRYVLKRLLTFGGVDRGYLDALAAGLQNLQDFLDPPEPDGDEEPAEEP